MESFTNSVSGYPAPENTELPHLGNNPTAEVEDSNKYYTTASLLKFPDAYLQRRLNLVIRLFTSLKKKGKCVDEELNQLINVDKNNLRTSYPKLVHLDQNAIVHPPPTISTAVNNYDFKSYATVSWICICALQIMKTFHLSDCSLWICMILVNHLRTTIPAFDEMYTDSFVQDAVIRIYCSKLFVFLRFSVPTRLIEFGYSKNMVTLLQTLTSPFGRDIDTVELTRRLNEPKIVLIFCEFPTWPEPSKNSFIVKAETSDTLGRTTFSKTGLESQPCRCLISCPNGFEYYHSTIDDCLTTNNNYTVDDRCLIGFVMIED